MAEKGTSKKGKKHNASKKSTRSTSTKRNKLGEVSW